MLRCFHVNNESTISAESLPGFMGTLCNAPILTRRANRSTPQSNTTCWPARTASITSLGVLAL